MTMKTMLTGKKTVQAYSKALRRQLAPKYRTARQEFL